MQTHIDEADVLRHYINSPEFEARLLRVLDLYDAGIHPTEPKLADILGLPVEIMLAFVARQGLDFVLPPEGSVH